MNVDSPLGLFAVAALAPPLPHDDLSDDLPVVILWSAYNAFNSPEVSAMLDR
jgi:hypothetical protein